MLLYTKYPSEDSKTMCGSKIESILEEFVEFKNKLSKEDLRPNDVIRYILILIWLRFLEADYLYINNELAIAIKNMEEANNK